MILMFHPALNLKAFNSTEVVDIVSSYRKPLLHGMFGN